MTGAILSTCPPGGLILDAFVGTATTAVVALKNAIRFLGVELNKNYVELAN
jgi:site-specific DNA-methyltransferase (adenine-specific)